MFKLDVGGERIGWAGVDQNTSMKTGLCSIKYGCDADVVEFGRIFWAWDDVCVMWSDLLRQCVPQMHV